eukprot:6472875-Amphidinium_carterae.2
MIPLAGNTQTTLETVMLKKICWPDNSVGTVTGRSTSPLLHASQGWCWVRHRTNVAQGVLHVLKTDIVTPGCSSYPASPEVRHKPHMIDCSCGLFTREECTSVPSRHIMVLYSLLVLLMFKQNQAPILVDLA